MYYHATVCAQWLLDLTTHLIGPPNPPSIATGNKATFLRIKSQQSYWANKMCHSCAFLKKFPDQLLQQLSKVPTEAFGCSFAANVLRRNRQLVLVLRACVTSYTKTRLIPDKRGDTLWQTILTMILDLHPLDGLLAVICVDPAPGFIALRNNNILHRFRISLDIGCVNNANKNPVAAN